MSSLVEPSSHSQPTPTKRTSRFALVPLDPDRRVPTEHDVVFFKQEQAHAWLQPSPGLGLRRKWLNGFQAGETDTIDEATLEYQAELGRVSILAENITNPEQTWWVIDDVATEYDGMGTQKQPLSTPGHLSFHRDRDRGSVNAFLDHDVVDHDLGSVVGWKASFSAFYQGERVAVAVLSRPTAPELDEAKIIQLSRFAAHPHRPPNTASWLLARARQWAALEGFDELRTYAGVSNDNQGTIYQATGYRFDGETHASGDGWQNRDGRKEWSDYTRRRYVIDLDRVRKPAPGKFLDEQATLNTFQNGTTTLGDGPAFARFDDHPDWSNDIYDEMKTPVHRENATEDADAVFGTITENGPASIAPIHLNDDRSEVVIDALLIDEDAYEYPSNAAAALLGVIREWSELEGCTVTFPAPKTEFETQACKQAQITHNTH